MEAISDVSLKVSHEKMTVKIIRQVVSFQICRNHREKSLVGLFGFTVKQATQNLPYHLR